MAVVAHVILAGVTKEQYNQGLCCAVRSQAMPRRDWGPGAGQMADLSSSNAVANRNSGPVSTASS
jgi:hypothetical protein